MKARILASVLIVSGLFVTADKSYGCGPAPVAILTANPQNVAIDCNTILDGSDSYDSDGYITKYEWDFTNNGSYDYYETSGYHPDGAFDGNTPHAYSGGGTYTAKLRVTDNGEKTNTDTCNVYVLRVHNITQGISYNVIQDAIDAANEDDVIKVYPDRYYENIDFEGKGITLMSSDPNDPEVVAATIIDANGSGTVVTFDTSEDTDSVLTGFTLTNGQYGVSCSNSSGPMITKCIIEDNSSCGVYSSSSSPPLIRNNCIYDNDKGIEFSSAGLAATVRNNTIVNNTSYGIYLSSGTGPNIINCILWGNSDDLYGCSATYSCIEDGDSGTGNISSYPYFADYDANDFHLTFNSPCIDRAVPDVNYPGQTDIDGESRVVDGRVDMGADEFNVHNVNLVKNPGFEVADEEDANYPADWGYSLGKDDVNHPGIITLDSNGYEGQCVKLYSDDSDTNSLLIYQNIGNLTGDEWYQISVMVKSSTNQQNYIILWNLSWKNENGDPVWKSFAMTTQYGNGVWTPVNRFFRVPAYDDYGESTADDTWRIVLAGTKPEGNVEPVYYDNVVIARANMFLPPYGCVNEPNVAETVEFGVPEKNINWIVGDINNVMTDPNTDPNDGNISYRELLSGWGIKIEFPAFNLDDGYDCNDPNDMNSLPLGPMLLEIMFKDTVDDETDGNKANGSDLVIVQSKVDYINLDPAYLIEDTNLYYDLAHLGGWNDNKWKYIQYAFQKSDHQLLRAIDGKFTIKISNRNENNIPIDYVSLRVITDDEYEAIADKQREAGNFFEAELPSDAPAEPNYSDPNLTVFVRDIMRPVYRHTKPGPNEPNSITGFSCWGEVEPASFAIYSENGINDLTVTVSNLTHADSNSIDGNDISIYHVIYDDKLLTVFGNIGRSKGYALVPDRLEEFTELSVEPNTSERVWLKIEVPDEDANLPAGLYQGNAYVKKTGETLKTVPIEFTVYDITLDGPNHITPVWGDPFRDQIYSSDSNEVFEAYSQTGFDPITLTNSYTHRIVAEEDVNGTIDFNSVLFEEYLDRMINEGFAKDTVTVWIPEVLLSEIAEIVLGTEGYIWNDPNLYYMLSDPNFKEAVGELIGKYTQIGESYDPDINFIFFPLDEPIAIANRRIIADRLSTIIHDCNGLTMVTYYPQCDEECDPGDNYNTPNDINIPALTNLIDYKVWSIGNTGEGYNRHNDPNDPHHPDINDHFGYYTTGVSDLRNPVYNRFNHGLFASGTDAATVLAYSMGGRTGDAFNDFDPGAYNVFPFAEVDFIFAYPTWSGKLLYTIGGLEGIREGTKDARYIATLKRIIEEYPNDPNTPDANDYLSDLRSWIDPNYKTAYYIKDTGFGYYKEILEDISDANDPNDFEAFTEIRKNIADYIAAIDPNS